MRRVSHNTVLGIEDHTFRLVKGELIDVHIIYETYGNVLVTIQGEKVKINWTMLDRISNKES